MSQINFSFITIYSLEVLQVYGNKMYVYRGGCAEGLEARASKVLLRTIFTYSC